MSKTENRNRIIKRIIFFMAIAAFVFLMWKVCVSSAITPMEQVTKDGWFEIKDSPIRGIRIYADSLKRDRSIGEVPEFSVRIDDSDGNTVWEKTTIIPILSQMNVLYWRNLKEAKVLK